MPFLFAVSCCSCDIDVFVNDWSAKFATPKETQKAWLSGVGIWKSFGPGGVDGLAGSVKDPHRTPPHPRPLRDNPKYLSLRDSVGEYHKAPKNGPVASHKMRLREPPFCATYSIRQQNLESEGGGVNDLDLTHAYLKLPRRCR
jgi:hypothetical protein